MTTKTIKTLEGDRRQVEVRFVYTHWVEVSPGEDPWEVARREIKEDGIDEIADYLVPLKD